MIRTQINSFSGVTRMFLLAILPPCWDLLGRALLRLGSIGPITKFRSITQSLGHTSDMFSISGT